MGKELDVKGILGNEDVEWIASQGEPISVQQGQVLIREGEPVESLFILLDGNLDVMRDGVQVSRVHSGEILGEISFVDSKPPLATVIAAGYSRVLRIQRDLVRARLATDAAFASRFFRAIATFLANRLRITTDRLATEATMY